MTDPRPCAVGAKTCGTPHRGHTICGGCIARLRQNLRSCEETRRELMVTLARQDQIGAATEGHSQKVEPDIEEDAAGEHVSDQWLRARPYSVRASNALHELRNELTTWVRLLQDETGDPLPQNRIVAMAAWLEHRLRYIAKHEAAGELVRGVGHVLARAETAIDIPRDRSKVTVGPCPEPEPTEGDPAAYCPGVIVAYIPQDRGDYRPCLMCTHEGCAHEGTEWTAERWARMGKRIRARQGAAEDVAMDERSMRRLVDAVIA